jgi:hypothetical protein
MKPITFIGDVKEVRNYASGFRAKIDHGPGFSEAIGKTNEEDRIFRKLIWLLA